MSAAAFAARNGIFACGDKPAEIATRDPRTQAETRRRQNDHGNPGPNGQSKPHVKMPSLTGLDGGGRSHAKPVSKGYQGKIQGEEENRARKISRDAVLARCL